MSGKQPGAPPRPKNRPWSPEDHDRLAVACKQRPVQWKKIAAELGRTVAACRQRASMGALLKGSNVIYKPCLVTGIRSRNGTPGCKCANCQEKRIVRRVKGRFNCPECKTPLALYGGGMEIAVYRADDLPSVGYRRVSG